MGPDNGLPSNFGVGHGLYVTPDDKFVYLQDWESAHLVKLDANTDRVLKIFDSSDGFVMPHGGFIAGSLR